MSLRRDAYKSCSLDILIPEHSVSIDKALGRVLGFGKLGDSEDVT